VTSKSIAAQRRNLGLSTPTQKEKLYLWERVSVPTANIGAGMKFQGYTPSESFSQMHFHPARERVAAGGVRGGKSLATGMEAFSWALHSDLIWFMGVDYSVPRMEFTYCLEALLSQGFTRSNLVSMPADRFKPCSLETVWGGQIETRTLSDLGKVAAHAPDAIFVCEPGLIPEFSEAVSRFRERSAQKRGLIWLAGTFEDSVGEYAAFYDYGQTWPNDDDVFSVSAPTWDNRAVFPGGRNDPEILSLERKLGDQFMERCGGVPTPPSSLVFHNYWEPLIHVRRELEYREDLPIEVAVDPNYGQGRHYSVEFVQWDASTGDTFLIDEVAQTEMTHDSILKLCAMKPFWHRITGGVGDPFAVTAHIFGNASVEQIWFDTARVVLRTKHRPTVDDAIERMNFFLRDGDGRTRVFFSDRCKRAIWEMSHWRRDKVTRVPKKDNCDAIKAVCYWLADRYSRNTSDSRTAIRELNYSWGRPR